MTRSVLCLAALPAVFLLLGWTRTAHAQTYIATDTIISTSLSGPVTVGYASSSYTNPTSPTVSLVSGSGGFDLYAFNGSKITVTSAGSVNNLTASDNSVVTVNGSLHNNLYVTGNSKVTVNSGSSITFGLLSLGNSQFTINGGSIGYGLDEQGSSTGNVSGGSIGTSIVLRDSSTLNLFGTGLGETLINPNIPTFPSGPTTFTQYALFGTLADGTNITGKFLYTVNGSSAKVNFINAVPEPGCVALLLSAGVASAGSLTRRRGHRAAV